MWLVAITKVQTARRSEDFFVGVQRTSTPDGDTPVSAARSASVQCLEDVRGALHASVGSAGCAPVVCTGSGSLETHDFCSVGVTSGPVDFGEVSVGHTAERTVTLKNFSTA